MPHWVQVCMKVACADVANNATMARKSSCILAARNRSVTDGEIILWSQVLRCGNELICCEFHLPDEVCDTGAKFGEMRLALVSLYRIKIPLFMGISYVRRMESPRAAGIFLTVDHWAAAKAFCLHTCSLCRFFPKNSARSARFREGPQVYRPQSTIGQPRFSASTRILREGLVAKGSSAHSITGASEA